MRWLRMALVQFTVWGTLSLLFSFPAFGQYGEGETGDSTTFRWPEGKKAAISLSFDDGRSSQIDQGLAIFDQYGARVTLYVVPDAVEARLEDWKRVVALGHEIGNHSLNHPCTGNFPWARNKALETFTIEQIRYELEEANRRIEALLRIKPMTFAYPCGQTFIGRGEQVKSYVPIAADLFMVSRGWLDEGPNDPAFCDLAQVLAMPADELDFAALKPIIDMTRERGMWLILAGHDIGESGRQVTRVEMLKELLEYVGQPETGFWVAPVGTVGSYIQQNRDESGSLE